MQFGSLWSKKYVYVYFKRVANKKMFYYAWLERIMFRKVSFRMSGKRCSLKSLTEHAWKVSWSEKYV
jgi:hypothetical protein